MMISLVRVKAGGSAPAPPSPYPLIL